MIFINTNSNAEIFVPMLLLFADTFLFKVFNNTYIVFVEANEFITIGYKAVKSFSFYYCVFINLEDYIQLYCWSSVDMTTYVLGCKKQKWKIEEKENH